VPVSNLLHTIFYPEFVMTPKDAFHHTVHGYPGGAASLAPRMNKSVAVLRNKANPNSDVNVITIDDITAVMDLTQNYSILYALATEHGHVCSKIDAEPAGDSAVLESITDVWAKLGSVGVEVHSALADGRVDLHEVRHIEAAIYTAIRPMMELLARIKSMAEK
jgi:hypothetical protein